MLARIRELARHLSDSDIADQLNREGQTSAKELPYTAKMIKWIRWRYQLPAAELKRPEELTVRQVPNGLAPAILSFITGSSEA